MKRYLLPLLFAVQLQAASTYYIDSVGGADANNGTSTGTPWRHHPYMVTWTGSYSHAAGDRFIFKGGVTWGYTNFPLTTTAGGTAGNSDYYGVDASWFTGGSWAKPIFDNQGHAIGAGTGNNRQVDFQNGYVTLDNIELTGFYWDAAHQGFVCGQILLWGDNTFIANCYVHGWSHDTLANGAGEDFNAIIPYAGTGVGNIISNCVIVGNGDSGVSIRGAWELITHNSLSNSPNSIVFEGTDHTTTISYNNIGPMMGLSFAAAHPNAIEQLNSASATFGETHIFGNYIHDLHPSDTSITVVFVGGNPGTGNCTNYSYNNVIWNVGRGPFEGDARNGVTVINAWNNTIAGPGTAMAFTGTVGGQNCYLYATNNHVINCGGVSENWTAAFTANSLQQSTAQATAAGYTVGNFYAPTAANSPTVDQGVSESALFSTDILGVARPQGAVWDIGAYEYNPQGGAPASGGTATATTVRAANTFVGH